MLEVPLSYSIKFRHRGHTTPKDHPTKTICRPDIIATRDSPDTPELLTENLYWYHVEATGEEDSSNGTEEGQAQEGAYTAYHLQARPDLVSVVGIYTGERDFTLFFSNAWRVYHTEPVEWSSKEGRQLLYAWIWRLYNPEVDPCINICINPKGKPTFAIKTNEPGEYDELDILRVGESIGRRTIMMRRPNPSCKVVIEEQYIESTRRFREWTVLEAIHKGGRFPGVVRLQSHGGVKNKNGEDICVKSQSSTKIRLKPRVVLKDGGIRLMDIGTPKELLMGVYDLLESEFSSGLLIGF